MSDTVKEYDEKIVLEKLKEYCAKFPTKGAAALDLDVSRVYLWRILEGLVPPPETVLKRIGYARNRKITYYTYRKMNDVHVD